METRRKGWTARRGVTLTMVGVLLIGAAAAAHRAWALLRVMLRHEDPYRPPVSGFADDASRLNLAPVVDVVDVGPDMEAAERQLREVLARAREQGLRVSIAGARHTMGG